jgi:hypothetical protein
MSVARLTQSEVNQGVTCSVYFVKESDSTRVSNKRIAKTRIAF